MNEVNIPGLVKYALWSDGVAFFFLLCIKKVHSSWAETISYTSLVNP